MLRKIDKTLTAMELFIYIQSPIFNTENNFFVTDKESMLALDSVNVAIKLEEINNQTIEALIAEHIKDTAPENFSEALLPFDGGVYLKENDLYIDSNCCGDISNVENWRTILTASNTNWETIWIGHPQIAYKMDEEYIYFSNYDNEAENGEFTIKFKLNKEAFLKLLTHKLKLFHACKQAFYNSIDNNNFTFKAELKKVLF